VGSETDIEPPDHITVTKAFVNTSDWQDHHGHVHQHGRLPVNHHSCDAGIQTMLRPDSALLLLIHRQVPTVWYVPRTLQLQTYHSHYAHNMEKTDLELPFRFIGKRQCFCVPPLVFIYLGHSPICIEFLLLFLSLLFVVLECSKSFK
jgi:hypothetical protein